MSITINAYELENIETLPRDFLKPKKKASSMGYTSQKLGVFSRLNEFSALLTRYNGAAKSRVSRAIGGVCAAMNEIRVIMGKPVENLDILEIGSGQMSFQLALLSKQNRVTGIDREYNGNETSLKNILNTIRKDGIVRAVKTVARRGLGFDRQARDEYLKQTDSPKWPHLNILKMDAEQMSLPNDSFDVIFSHSVFEHIANPIDVLREAKRVLRVGGVFYCELHLYSSDSGCHDIRIFADRRESLPLWSHLRDDHKRKVIQNTYLNKISLQQWRTDCESIMPGCRVEATRCDETPELVAKLAEIRENGELLDHSDEELFSSLVKVVWTK